MLTLVHSPRLISTAAGDTPLRQTPAATPAPTAALPPHVEEMRDQILTAVRSGRLADLETAIEWNELPPEFGNAAGTDPLAHLKTLSADGEGREMLAIIGNILATAPAKLPIGADPENNIVYVWPGLAEKPLDKLTPGEHVELLRLMPAAEAKGLIEKKKWTWWRLAIGADGTWLTFLRRP